MNYTKKQKINFKFRASIETAKFRYLDENDFIKKYRALRRVAPKTFKYLCFKFFKETNFEKQDGVYIVDLPTNEEFKKIYGQIQIKYSVHNEVIVIEDLVPQQFLLKNYEGTFKVYKGIPYIDEKDLFKVKMYFKTRGEN